MTEIFSSAQALEDARGRSFGPTPWLIVAQDRIDAFAKATGDLQWIHVDSERAKEGPFGITIAHGYLTLSLVNYFLPQLLEVRNMTMGVNYGCDRVRFPAAVPCGSRVRGHAEILDVEAVAGGVRVRTLLTVEIEGGLKPACVAETLSQFYF